MGFLPDIRRILRHIPARRQTLFFSATMPPPIAALASEMLKNPVHDQPAAAVGAGGRHHAGRLSGAAGAEVGAASRAAQTRSRAARRWCSRGRSTAPTVWPIIWCSQRVNAARIHGNRSQAQRTEALAGFKSGKYRVLVATDIAARGIDVEALSHVVNFDVPAVPDDYIHRVGRTGRAELTGDAFTFVAPDEEGGSARHRARGRADAAAGDAAGLRLQGTAAGASSRFRWLNESPRSGSGRRRSGPGRSLARLAALIGRLAHLAAAIGRLVHPGRGLPAGDHPRHVTGGLPGSTHRGFAGSTS